MDSLYSESKHSFMLIGYWWYLKLQNLHLIKVYFILAPSFLFAFMEKSQQDCQVNSALCAHSLNTLTLKTVCPAGTTFSITLYAASRAASLSFVEMRCFAEALGGMCRFGFSQRGLKLAGPHVPHQWQFDSENLQRSGRNAINTRKLVAHMYHYSTLQHESPTVERCDVCRHTGSQR